MSRVLLMILLLLAPPAGAKPLPPLVAEDGLDAGFARAAVLRGDILPLDRILHILRARFEGEIIEIQLELEEGLLTYEFDLISPDGRVYEVEIDAATGTIMEFEDGEGEED